MPTHPDLDRLRSIKTFPSLVKYLRDELGWPIDADGVDELTFDYSAEELGLDAKHAARIKEIKQLRPLETDQPWGIFWVSFEKKKLPMVVLRRILGNLITKSRASANQATRPTWRLNDLLFISSYGEEEHRNISFAHFSESANGQLPVLRVLGWDDQNSIMHLDRVANRLQSNLRWPDAPADVEKWRTRWSDAFTERYREAIQSADVLIQHLARLASNIRKRVSDVLEAEVENGPMRKLFAAVRGLLIHDMTEDAYADMYAQTVAYGLLSANFSRKADLTPQNLVQLASVANPFLESLLESLFRLNRGKFHFDVDEVGINDVLDLLRNTNIEAIKAAFNDLNPAEDPVIRFYEGFLRAYDSEQRIKRGVFFTPRPVVSYIVRSVHELLQTEFGLEDGLASTATWADMLKKFPDLQPPKDVKPDDPFVLILDIATGTATFLHECIEVIERTMKTKWARALGKRDPESPRAWRDPEILARWRDYVPKHLLPRLYGFEIMMAPYAIAHLKLALKLGETGYQFRDGDRLHIYLTNTLEPPSDIADAKLADLFGPLAREAQEVNHIKRTKRFTVVMGNPPYAGVSANMSQAASALIEPYKFVDGQPLGERKHWLQDDYVKFIRLAQLVVESAGIGMLGYITNHGYLDNPTFRGMRQSLMKSFSDIRVLDLHGSVKKRDKTTLSKHDENVFDIEQGVAIGLFSRPPNPHVPSKVQHTILLGPRELKYEWLTSHALESQNQICPSSPYYFFVKREETHREEYEALTPVTSVFQAWSTGVQTSRDSFAIAPTRQELEKRLREFVDSSVADDHLKFSYGLKDMSFWQVAHVRRDFRKLAEPTSYIKPIDYRPFDTQYVVFHEMIIHRPKAKIMRHMLAGENLALLLPRQLAGETFHHAFCTKNLAEMCVISTKTTEQNNLFPLYLYDQDGGLGLSLPEGRKRQLARTPNLAGSFLKALAGQLRLQFGPGDEVPKGVTPEDIFHYVYGVFHSPGYRSRYAEFLKIDFPRLPLTGNLELFRALARLGCELVALHLLEFEVGRVTPCAPSSASTQRRAEDCPPYQQLTEFIGDKNPVVEKVSWSKNTVWLDKDQTTGFKGVREDVWNFHIGGYQVCEKWLKDRKGRNLSADDRAHYQKVIIALSETIRLMAEIDAVIETHGGWPLK